MGCGASSVEPQPRGSEMLTVVPALQHNTATAHDTAATVESPPVSSATRSLHSHENSDAPPLSEELLPLGKPLIVPNEDFDELSNRTTEDTSSVASKSGGMDHTVPARRFYSPSVSASDEDALQAVLDLRTPDDGLRSPSTFTVVEDFPQLILLPSISGSPGQSQGRNVSVSESRTTGPYDDSDSFSAQNPLTFGNRRCEASATGGDTDDYPSETMTHASGSM